ncbi:MAG: toast rack family protein [Vicinamibacterales bacterium]
MGLVPAMRAIQRAIGMWPPLVALTAVALTSACTWDGPAGGPVQRDHTVVDLDKSASTRVRVTMRAGELSVKGGARGLLEADFSYSVPDWKATITHDTTAAESELTVSQGAGTSPRGKTENQWQLVLNDARPLDVVVNVGAGKATLTLGSLALRSVDVEIGAGELDVDLRGHPTQSYRVKLHGGVGSATVHLPSAVGISASASGGIGGIDVSGLEKRGDRWVNPRALSSPVTIDLDASGGVGEIKIVAE